jgi:hypothetical protein
VAFDDIDAEKLRLEQLLANNIEPRLPRIDLEAVGCAEGRHVLVIRSHKSWIGPHRVTVNDKFYGRNSAGKYPLDVSELRSAFVLGESVAERMRNFRRDRLIKISAGETPMPLHPGATMIIHAVPFSGFSATPNIDIINAVANGHVMPLPPGRFGRSNNYAVNLDGFATFNGSPGESVHAYAQIFRSGAIEGVDVLSTDEATGTPYILGQVFENTIVSAVKNYLHFLQSIEIELPVVLFVSFCGVRGCHLRIPAAFGGGFYPGQSLREDVIALPDVLIDHAPVNVPGALKLTFNTIWNAFGHMKSDKYNDAGEWIGAS